MNNQTDYATLDLNNHDPKHLLDYAKSAIDPDIIRLNFRSVGQAEAFGFLVRDPKRRNDGRLTDRYLRIYDRLANGGWICTGTDPVTMLPNEWGCLKPDDPRWDIAKEKHIKYEHPYCVPTEVFCLRITYRIGLKIAKQQGLAAEAAYRDRMGDVDPAAEDCDFWQWVKDTPQLIVTPTEGAKKTGSLLSAGCLAIGLPGIFGGYRSTKNGMPCIPHLIPQLDVFAVKGREIAFCFDNDIKLSTIANVKIATAKTGKLAQRKGCDASVVSWTEPYKGIDDLIYHLGVGAFDRVFNCRRTIDRWQLDSAFDISDLPQTVVNLGKPDFANLAPRPDTLDGTLFAIKAAKGVGKTELYAKVTEPYRDAGRPLLILSHRIQLAKELAGRTDIDYISDVRYSDTGALFGYSMCVDSLHRNSQARFDPAAWAGGILSIDECEQVLWHMLNSPTCQANRIAILRTFAELLTVIAETGGAVILSDADLSKVSIDYIQNLCGNKLKLCLLNNTYIPNKGNRKLHVHESPCDLLAAASAAIGAGDAVLIHSSSQQLKSKWSPQNLETCLNSQHPSRSTIVMDAETVADPTHPAYGCISRINETVAEYRIGLASPVIETGISIDTDHYNSVWALANGVQTADAVCQTIERVRSDVDRHICITTGGIKKIGNGSCSPWGLIQSQHKAAKANMAALSLAGLVEDADGHQHHMTAWSNYAAKINQEYSNYKQHILDKLHAEGYEIVQSLATEATDMESKMGDARDTNYQVHRECIMAAAIPDDIEFKHLQKKTAKTKAERRVEAKGKLTRRYLTSEITDDLIRKDDGGWHPQVQLYYYLTIGHKHLADRDKKRLQSLSPNGHQPFVPDINKATLSAKILALQAVNVSQFFGEDKTFTATSLADWFDLIKTCSSDIKNYLGVGIGEKSTPITTAQRLLGILGYRLTLIDRVRIEGKRTFRYSGVAVDCDCRSEVLQRWLDRDDRVAAMMAECPSIPIRSNNSNARTEENDKTETSTPNPASQAVA